VFTNPVTITINVGWGEVAGHSIAAGNVAQSQFQSGTDLTYSQVFNAFANDHSNKDNLTAFQSLPASDPTNNPSARYRVTSAEMEAFGLSGDVGPTNDLYVGLSNGQTWTFDPNNRAVAGAHDAIGALEHEISEVMGRYGSLGSIFGSNIYTPLDLFRYASANTRQLSVGPGWFSIDGQHLLKQYNDPSNGADAVDWLHPADGGFFGDSYGNNGTNIVSAVTATDLREMNIIGWNRSAPSDFDADAVSDLLWRRGSTGEVDTWLMTDGNMSGGRPIGTASTSWGFVGAGNFAGGATSDALWRNGTSGEVDSWLISNDAVTGGSAIGTMSSVWASLGAGDFNGDGVADVLWRNNNSGAVDTWLMNNGHVGGGAALGSVSSAWQFAGTGDFDGDVTTDVLWHNTSTGEVDTWLVSNDHVTGGAAIGFASSVWQCLGTGDFNADGTSDILWRNSNTGEVDTWLVSNDRVTGGVALGSASSVWQFCGIGQYTGDGTGNILWRNNNTGEVDTWIIRDDRLAGGSAIGTASSVWQPLVIATG
jgi:FG-GAP repeat